ncbi:MAG: carboxy terminal-processing peptidase [Verrucomicrobiota bacterium]
MNSVRNFIFTVAALSFGASLQTSANAETDYGQVSQYVANMLQNNHYSRRDFDDEVSAELLYAYLKFLDYNKLYFTQEDVAKFEKKYGKSLDDYVLAEADISPAQEIYSLFEKRVEDRVKMIEETLENSEFTFDSDRSVERRRKDSPWPKNKADADEIWSRILEGQLLDEEIRKRNAEENADKDKPAKKDEEEEEKKKTPKEQILERYSRFYKSLEENDEEDICNYFLSALATVYDPHSEYLSQSELENFTIGMNNQLFGIGALLGMDEGAAKIQGLVVNGPAEKAGELKVNDRIVGVAQGEDGEMVDILYMKLNDIVEMIRGKAGTKVRLEVIPAASADDSQTKEIVIVRDKVELKDKLANADLVETVDSKGRQIRLGWIYLYSFYADMDKHLVSTTRDVRLLLDRLMKENIQGLVLDLRGNGGGALEEAIDLTGLFIKKGPVVQAKDWRGKKSNRDSTNHWPVYDGPMIVLVDKVSASASEILAAALQDYERAVIVGDSATFGKGTVQTIMNVARYMPILADKQRAGALKVTIQKFYRINGGSTQLKGVTPDIVLPSYRDIAETGEQYLENPLEFDRIEARPYNTFTDNSLPVESLAEASKKRIAQDVDFLQLKEDIARLRREYEENSVSLNLEQRLAENAELKEQRRERIKERRDRYAKIEEAEKGKLNIYKLTLDNVDAEELVPLSDFDEERFSGMIRPKTDDDRKLEDKEPDAPSGLDFVRRETIHSLVDLIELTAAAQTAKVTNESSGS